MAPSGLAALIVLVVSSQISESEGAIPLKEFAHRHTQTSVKQDVFFLPKTLSPLYYDIEIGPDIYETDPSQFFFYGFEKITIECQKSTNEVIMHLVDLEVTPGSIEFGSETASNPPKYASHEIDPDNQLIKIALDKDMTKGELYFIQMNFTGTLKDNLMGFYLSSYQRNGDSVYLATTQFESVDARRAFPCFDEPEFKAHFNMTVVRREDLISISNMKITQTIDTDPGFKADIYETTPSMSTYLLAFVVSDFKFISGRTTKGLEYRVWAQQESLDKLQYSLDVGTRAIVFYEDYFDIDYPLPKQDMIAIPDFAAGAMENWGLITYRAVLLFFTEGVTSNSAKQRVNTVITHELAHQWFGNLVTMKWWSDLWLNEGFATFFMYVAASDIEPDWDLYNQFVIEEMLPAYAFDGRVTSHPVFVDVKSPQEIDQIFDAISYNKGGCILRMLKFFIGDTAFQNGLRRYLKSREYENAEHDDLFAALKKEVEKEAKNIPVVDIMQSWILQMNYPVVHVSRQGQKKLRIKQDRFLFEPASTDPKKYVSPFNYTWDIPFTFTTSQQLKFDVTGDDVTWVMRNDTADVYDTTVTIPDPSSGDGWVIGNIQYHGYYRVTYDDDNWRNIIKQMKSDHKVIIPINRAQVIADAMDLARAGLLDQRIALETLEYLSSELDYYPWTTARDKMVYIDQMIRSTEIYPQFQEFMRKSSKAAFDTYGLRTPAQGQVPSFAQREVAGAACEVFNDDCLSQARELFVDWRDNPTENRINPELLKTVLCTGISEGVADDWFFLYDAYQTETELSMKNDMLRSLTCSQEPDIILTLLERAIQPSEIRKQDAVSLITAAPSMNPAAQPIVWDFIRDNYPTLRDNYSSSVGGFESMILSATATFNTEAKLKEITDFVDATPDLGAGKPAFKQAEVKTKSNIEWMEKNYPIVKAWLEDQALMAEV